MEHETDRCLRHKVVQTLVRMEGLALNPGSTVPGYPQPSWWDEMTRRFVVDLTSLEGPPITNWVNQDFSPLKEFGNRI